MNTVLMNKVENTFMKKDLPNFEVGDTISVTYKLIEDMPKGWTRARYEAHEQLLIPVVQKLHMDLGEMDLYLWYAVKNTVDK